MSTPRPTAFVLLCLAGVGCAALDPRAGQVFCTHEMRPAVIVEIRDAQTNAPLAQQAFGAVREGAYVDSLRPAESLTAEPSTLLSRAAAHERTGTYSIEVRRPGYATFTASNVRVDKDACHVLTARVQAALVPVP
jgi:hypothetical protein